LVLLAAAAGNGSGVAQDIAAVGTAAAAVIGALVLWPTRRRRERAAAAGFDEDPADRPAMLRERIRALEIRADAADRTLEEHTDQLGILRSLQVAVEQLARPVRAAQRRAPRE
jgi:hypothetical protein